MISIIVPIYNKEKYLKQCIESILAQTFLDIEIILVDDGSTDSSLTICEEYKNVDNRLFVYSKKNGGVSSARNFGLDNSHGDYVAFVDPDDYVHPELMYSLMECLQEECADISYCFAMDFHENSSNMNTRSHESGKRMVIRLNQFDWRGWSSHATVWGALFRRSVVKEIRFDESLSIAEDTYFFANCIKRADKIVCLDRALYYYCLNDDSITGHKYFSKKMDELRAWEMLCKLFEGNDFSYISAKAGYAQTAKNIIRKNCNNQSFMDIDYMRCKKVWYKNFRYELLRYLCKHEWILAAKCLFSYAFWNSWLQREKLKV